VFGIQKGYFHGNARTDRCIGNNNRGIVFLTVVSMVTTEVSMRSNGRRYKKVMHSRRQSWDSHRRRRLGSSHGQGELRRLIEILGQEPSGIASGVIVRCKCECPIKISEFRDPRKVICRVTYPTRDNWSWKRDQFGLIESNLKDRN
jgi:hypothetical protein